MQPLKIIILSLAIFSTFLSAKVVEGTFKLNTFRDGSKNSFDTIITVKYKIESLMGEPVVKATAKYEIGQLIDIDEKYIKKEMDNYVKYYKEHKNIGKTGSWNYAKKYCQTLTLNGFTDWRLATIAELDKIKDKRNNFKNTKKKKFRCIWSSNKGYIFSFNEYDKGNKGKWKNKLSTINFVRCVRELYNHRKGSLNQF